MQIIYCFIYGCAYTTFRSSKYVENIDVVSTFKTNLFFNVVSTSRFSTLVWRQYFQHWHQKTLKILTSKQRWKSWCWNNVEKIDVETMLKIWTLFQLSKPTYFSTLKQRQGLTLFQRWNNVNMPTGSVVTLRFTAVMYSPWVNMTVWE